MGMNIRLEEEVQMGERENETKATPGLTEKAARKKSQGGVKQNLKIQQKAGHEMVKAGQETRRRCRD